MMNEPFLPQSRNLSKAWTEVFLKLMERGVEKLAPALVIVTDFDDKGVPSENIDIRKRLDRELAVQGRESSHTAANTIFPDSLWNPNDEDDATALFDRYEKIWPRIKKCQQNSLGVYFRRLTAFSSKGDKNSGNVVNQLQHIIATYKSGNHRVSALQASVFDPIRDHTHRRQQGFPCLQQVAFVPIEGKDLCVNGFYATQYAFDRAYGNYLGLCRLGRFMAAQMGLTLVQMTCFSAVVQRSNPKISKESLRTFADDLQHILPLVRTESE